MDPLNGLQHDVLLEALSLSVGTATTELNQLTNTRIELQTRRLDVLDRPTLKNLLTQAPNSDINTASHYAAINQEFIGTISGCTSLFLSKKQSEQLILPFINDQQNAALLLNYQKNVLCEIGNIILNSGISAFAKLFNLPIQSGLPQYFNGDFQLAEKNTDYFSSAQESTLCISIDIRLNLKKINAYLIYFMKPDALAELIRLIDNYINCIYPVQNIS